MEFKENTLKPLFMQIAEWIEDEILKDNIKEGDKIFSQIEFAKAFNVNPITAGKGVSLLEARGILEKRRGLGMFVVLDAKSLIFDYRKNSALTSIIDDLVDEAKVLGINCDGLIEMIKKRMKEHCDND